MSYFKRKTLGITDYKKRLKLIASNKPRLVVRRSLRHSIAQIVEYNEKGDKVLVSATTKELSNYNWGYSTSNIPASYLLGLLIGKKANKKNIKESVLDFGLQRTIGKGVLYAVLKGALDSGLNIPHDKEIFPEESRIKGDHISKFISSNKHQSFQFSRYKKLNLDNNIMLNFDKTKENIIKNA
ncbi:50S ribosomal protein L18 [Candidatus Woesearchaeota archaeon]|nr:50S ribosomal protein L18 [Candidatus Woesearchaeota archaeon]